MLYYTTFPIRDNKNFIVQKCKSEQKMLKDFKISSSKYFIIDCDVSGDDALCIIMAALICKRYDKVLLGIT